MANPISFNLDSPLWLRRFRWLAILGMIASVLGARLWGVEFPCKGIFICLGFLAVWNFFLPFVEEHFSLSTTTFVFIQILVDVCVLTAILWFSGGLVNPFIEFLLLHVLIAGLLLTPILTVLVSLLTIVSVATLTFAPSIMRVEGKIIDAKDSPIWFGLPLGLIILILITNGFMMVFFSRLKKAQEQLRRRAKMDALARLVAGLAHEIGTPLNSILVLSKEMVPYVASDHKKDLEIISDQARRCGDMVSLLLGYSRTFVRHSDDIKYIETDIVQWVTDIYEQLAHSEDKISVRDPVSIKFTVVKIIDQEKFWIPPLILRQTLENLFKNSRDAVSNVHDPSIRVEILENFEEGEWEFHIIDNGPGFSSETREKAFDAFFSTKKQGVGNGLGLYISHYLLDQVGGRIVIDELWQNGAKMVVGIPKHESQRSESND
ncbi:MAG: HAMP domain-containing histidine kinase [Oligoflexia bacterium]|nr:HAMP domain-containing histidine kinase [Oligoflexia bacterium]